MKRGRVRLGAPLPQRRHEGNQRACFLLLLLPELLQSVGNRLILQNFDDISHVQSIYPGDGKHMLFDKAPCYGLGGGHHRGLKSNLLGKHPSYDGCNCTVLWQKLSCVEGTSRGRLQIAWHGYLPPHLPPGRGVFGSVQVAHVQYGGRNLNDIKQHKPKFSTRGVVEEWGESVTHLSSGPCLALQVWTTIQNVRDVNIFSTARGWGWSCWETERAVWPPRSCCCQVDKTEIT